MSDETSKELESIANELDEIADHLGSTNMLRARQLRGIVRRVVLIARNVPIERETTLEIDSEGSDSGW